MRSPDPWIHGRSGKTDAPLDPHDVLARAYESVREEADVELSIASGAMPRELDGTYYRNGPGRLAIGGERYAHPFDGDGMVVRFRIEGGRVRYRNRYVRTRELLEEEEAGRMLHRAFGTQRPGGMRANLLRARFKNAANTSVLWHADALYALWEGGWPHRLDPTSLATVGRDDLRGALRSDSRLDRLLGIEWPFAAHPALDPMTGELWGFGVLTGRTPRLAIYRLDARGTLIERRIIDLPRTAFIHDFALTEKHAVFVIAPIAFDAPRALLGLSSPVDSLRRDPSAPTTILLVPRDGGPVQTLDARPGFAFHHVNAWEDGRTIVIDTLRMDELDIGSLDVLDPSALRARRVVPAIPTRMVVDLARGRVDEEIRIPIDAELPTIDPRRKGRATRYAWTIARPDGWRALSHPALARLDLSARTVIMRDLAPDLPGEPLFVPRPGGKAEDDGWVLTIVYRARDHRSELLVLDARDLTTIASAPLPHHVPPGFHGTFVPAKPRATS